MKHLLLGLTILLPTLAFAKISLKLDSNNYRGNDEAIFTGADATELQSLIDNKSFRVGSSRGIKGINCQGSECRISFHGEVFSNMPEHSDIQRESIELNTFFQTFTPSESETLVSIPSRQWYFHLRDEVVESDRALYKFLSSKKNAVKDELDGNKTISIEGKNFKLSCLKQTKPERYEMAKCISHGGCLPSVFSKFIRITHQCRSYLKADLSKP